MSTNSSQTDAGSSTSARCNCGSVCWMCCGAGAPGGDPSAHKVNDAVQKPATRQPQRGAIRPLRSWSSSEKRGPMVDDGVGRALPGQRRFSVAGPASSSTVSSRRSRTLLALHTWAEEEDEMQQQQQQHDTAGEGRPFVHASIVQALAPGRHLRNTSDSHYHQQQSSRLHIGSGNHYLQYDDFVQRAVASHGVAGDARPTGDFRRLENPSPAGAFMASSSHATGSTSSGFAAGCTNSNSDVSIYSLGGAAAAGRLRGDLSKEAGLSGGPYVKRPMVDSTHNFFDMGSSSSSSGPPSFRQNIGGSHNHNHNGGSSSSSSSHHQHAHPVPHSISIPSRIGSPLSFTQSFLASRSSMYGRHPPSSQIRAAHIDWDSLSMMEELAAWSSASGGNRSDLSMWQQHQQPPHGMALPFDAHHGGASGSGGMSTSKFSRNHPYQRHYLPPQSHTTQHYYHQPQQHLPPHLPPQPPLASLQHQQHPFPAGPVHPLHMPGHGGRHPHHCAGLPDPAAATAGMASSGVNSAPCNAAAGSGGGPDLAYLSLLREWERQLTWDFACCHHPMLTSFSTASPHKLSASWRGALMAILALSAVCVVAGIPLALTVLLAKEDVLLGTRHSR
ncbi:hypothetical protein GQ54DRAFT_296455 [Martensiomyces pterosporus]|nr:hypothetical protein GQ54DRAFT_296455 [Martensiomyces pterosporus]